MAVDFFNPDCIDNTNSFVFGICDDPPTKEEPAEPAYLDFEDSEKWIAWVDNDLGKQVTFTAVDHCIDIKRANGEVESSCDGMLYYDLTLIFVELKDSNRSGWLGKAIDQLQVTIGIYKAEVGLNEYNRYYAYVANKQRPYFNAANPALAEKFEDDTDFILMVDQVIKIH